MSLRLVARSLCTLALATLFLPREARAQVDMYFQPIDPSPTQAAGLTVTVDVCGYAQTFPSLLSVSAFWNGTAVTNYSLDQVNHGCPGFYQGGTFRLTFSLTAAPGTNTLAVSVLDQNFNFFTETGDYYFGAWVTPRTGATMRASTQSAPLTLYLQNTTGGTQTYDFDLVCAPAGIIESCQMAPGSTSKTLTSGASDSVRVLANTGSAGNTGDVTVRPRINGEYADAVTIPVTLITPTMTVAEPQANVNYFPGVERTLTFQISNGATVSTNLNPLCPVSWNCYIAGGSPRNIGPSTAVDLKFTPTGTTTSNVGILAYDPLQLANRDSATVAVGILTPTVTVTQQGAQTQPYAARSNQSVVFTIGNPVTVQFNYTVTCVNVTGCPSGGQVNAGSQNVTIPFTMPSFGMTGSVTVTATQDQEPGNTASRTVTLPTTTSAFFLPGTKTITRLPGIATADTVWLKGLAAPSNPQSFTLTVQCAPAGYSCGGITPSPASPVSTADSVRAIISFTPGANGTTGTIQVEARETSLPLNLATATITVNATNAPTLTLTPASPPGATKSSYGGGPDTAKYVAKWTGSSPLTVTAFTHNCSGAVVGCQPPNHVGYPPIPTAAEQ